MEEAANGQDFREDTSAQGAGQPAGGMGDWLAEHEQSMRQWRRNDVVEGVVVSTDRDEFLVDIGAKSEAVVPINEVPSGPGVEVPNVGDTVLAVVLSGEDQEGRVVLSLTRARPERGWRNLQLKVEAGVTAGGAGAEHQTGGLVVNAPGVPGLAAP